MFYKLIVTLLFLMHASFIYAGEITYTGRAHIVKDDVRAAQTNSLNNALIGGLSSYVKSNAKDSSVNVTPEYLMFVTEYQILERNVTDDYVVTKVKLVIDDMIAQDMSVHAVNRSNTAVFLAKGLPDFVKADTIRKNIGAIFNEYYFTVKDQISFEQEIIDISSGADALMAFQSISSQYYFEFNFNLTSFKAGESCTLTSSSSYASIADVNKSVPVLRTEITVEEASAEECIYRAVNESVRASLKQTRDKLVKSPEVQLKLNKFQLVFTGKTQLKSINSIINDVKKRKYVVGAQMSEFFNNQAVYVIESYYSAEELAAKLRDLEYVEVERINVTLDNTVNLVLR